MWWRPRSGSPPGGRAPHATAAIIDCCCSSSPAYANCQASNKRARFSSCSRLATQANHHHSSSLFMPHSPCPTHLIANSLHLSLAKAKEQSSIASTNQSSSIPVDTTTATTMATPKAMRIGGRAWRLMRLAVLWARKGSAEHSLRLLKALRVGGVRRKDRQLRYGEREFSIDETPAFRFRTPSARVLRFIPCIAPAVPATPVYYGEDRYFFCDNARDRDEACCVGDYYEYDDAGEQSECGVDEGLEDEQLIVEDAGVDVKADEFIARFHAQMKLQRQISWLQYNEMMQRSIC